jgi:hypothetical protein
MMLPVPTRRLFGFGEGFGAGDGAGVGEGVGDGEAVTGGVETGGAEVATGPATGAGEPHAERTIAAATVERPINRIRC